MAVVLALALLTLSNLYGQRSDGSATYRGRPAMAGAQSGTGAQAGLPQGGLGQQGTEGAERTIVTWPAAPSSDNNALQPDNILKADVEPPPDITGQPREVPRKGDEPARDKDKGVTPPKPDSGVAPAKDSGIAPSKDSGMAKDESSAAKKARKAAKDTADKARFGVSPIGSTAPTVGPTGN
ncbi:hypothetical protein UC35_10615 [Ramlibacter tataouinensis]|uniref:Uncharacterized protein n=1 Tax=Ramlibacter tataouinensis TaxID=94132 RepID=A0A127JTH2_9BURK|nr:hypothetical protein UC35_10615 [Ramlibacter tataouinensis]